MDQNDKNACLIYTFLEKCDYVVKVTNNRCPHWGYVYYIKLGDMQIEIKAQRAVESVKHNLSVRLDFSSLSEEAQNEMRRKKDERNVALSRDSLLQWCQDENNTDIYFLQITLVDKDKDVMSSFIIYAEKAKNEIGTAIEIFGPLLSF